MSDTGKQITVELSARSFREAAKQVRKYNEELNRKCEELCRELCEEGLRIARGYVTGTFSGFVVMESEIKPEQSGCKAMYYMADSQSVTKSWLTQDGEKSATISPSLMIEFGSGLKAQNPSGVPGVGTGTFPGGTHGDDPSGWWFMDLDGVWHHSDGYAPKMPMYRSSQELKQRVSEIARRVFS